MHDFIYVVGTSYYVVGPRRDIMPGERDNYVMVTAQLTSQNTLRASANVTSMPP